MKKHTTTKLFPGALAQIMEKNLVNQVKLSAAAGIAVSRLNNYLQGKYRTIKPAHIEGIVQNVTADVSDRADIVKAYVLDLLPPFAKEIITIDTAAGAGRDFEAWYLQKNRLPGSFAGEFEQLYKACVAHPQTRERTAVWIQIMLEADALKQQAQ